MGCSLLSIAEIFYFLAFKFFKKESKVDQTSKTSNTEVPLESLNEIRRKTFENEAKIVEIEEKFNTTWFEITKKLNAIHQNVTEISHKIEFLDEK